MTTSIYQSSTLEKRTQDFLKKAKEVHNNKYDYYKVKYINNKISVDIICPEHGSFPQTPNSHLNGRGCLECGNDKLKSNNEEFIEKANKVHNNFYIYDKVVYKGALKNVIIECPEHGDFPQTPGNHLRDYGCPYCANRNCYSKVAIKWLNSIDPNIQHAENGGEYRIIKLDGTYFKADGYCKETNTVYEFHGDVFHGNPDLFEPNTKCHPFNKDITAKELYDKTIEREEYIKSLGYNLVVMWENDYN